MRIVDGRRNEVRLCDAAAILVVARVASVQPLLMTAALSLTAERRPGQAAVLRGVIRWLTFHRFGVRFRVVAVVAVVIFIVLAFIRIGGIVATSMTQASTLALFAHVPDATHLALQLGGRYVVLAIGQAGKQFAGGATGRPLGAALREESLYLVLVAIVNAALRRIAFGQQADGIVVTLVGGAQQPVDALRCVGRLLDGGCSVTVVVVALEQQQAAGEVVLAV